MKYLNMALERMRAILNALFRLLETYKEVGINVFLWYNKSQLKKKGENDDQEKKAMGNDGAGKSRASGQFIDLASILLDYKGLISHFISLLLERLK